MRESEFWPLPTVSVEAFSEVLRRFTRLRGAGERKLLLVVLHRAGWHVSGRVEVPEGVGVVFLPPILRSSSRWRGCGPR